MAEKAALRAPSAALVLGVLSGCLAAVAVIPTAIPLTVRLQDAEEALAIQHVLGAAEQATRLYDEEGALPPGTEQRLGVDHVHVRTSEGLLAYQNGPDLAQGAEDAACDNTLGASTYTDADGAQWAVACIQRGERVVAAWRMPETSSLSLVYPVLGLALLVGIVTAVGILRLLSPLSRLSNAIQRVGAGEHGVRLTATGLRELDEIIERLNDAAQAMENREDSILGRISAVRNMARLIAHEVRNPLQSLELLTTLVAQEEDPKERQELANAIHSEIRALDMVVNRVLREGTGQNAIGLHLHRTDQMAGPLVDHVLALRRPEAKAHGITLERGPVSARTLSIDSALLGRSIENLVLNALQAVPPRGGVVRVSVVDEEARVAIVVEDNGPGVDSALGDHIFEPNVTGRTGGTGLGLALVKEVVEAHGGYIVQDRSPLGGARFTARIPTAEGAVGTQIAQGPDRR